MLLDTATLPLGTGAFYAMPRCFQRFFAATLYAIRYYFLSLRLHAFFITMPIISRLRRAHQ